MSMQDLELPRADPPSLDEERELMHRRMLSSVSHDLKTPLAAMIGSLEVYERMYDKLPQARREELIHVALQEAYRLDSFVTNILDMAKLEGRLVRVQKEATDVVGLIKACLQRMQLRLENCAVAFHPAAPLVAATDSVLLIRALSLVIDNAVKYGGIPCEISLSCGQKDQQGFISVRDNGVGIPPARLEAIFCKYTRFAVQDQQAAGTGLGLAICRAMMELLGGTVTAENAPDQGMIFTLSFDIF